MRILIASTVVPFVHGGGTLIVDWLEQKLREFGHDVDVLRLPFHSYWPEMLEQTLALRLLNVGEHADRLIAIRTPSYVIKHPNKVLWFIHHHRAAYDFWNSPYRDIPNNRIGLSYRDAIYRADMRAFSEAKAIFTNSKVVSDRLQHFNQVQSEVLYPPVLSPERFRCDEYGDYILYVSRGTHHKRQHLAVEALSHTKTSVKLILAGNFENDAYRKEVDNLVAKNNLTDRVIILDRWISEEEKIELLAKCLAAVYCPLDEDSYGYPSLEAHHARKAVVTTKDAGGVLELITDGENGYITENTPQAVAQAFDSLYANKLLAKKMGEVGLEKLKLLGINWPHVIARLTA